MKFRQVTEFSSTFRVDERLEHFVADRNHLRVGLIAALRDDHARKFVCEIDVRHFKSRWRDRAAKVAGRLDVRRAGVVRRLEKIAARTREAGRVVELRDGDLREAADLAVRVRTRDDA